MNWHICDNRGLGCLYLLLQRRITLAAIVYGTCVHFKIYPLIFAPAVALYLLLTPTVHRQLSSTPSAIHQSNWIARVLNGHWRVTIKFTIISASIAIALTAFFYVM
jgi:hypothetical protein